MSATLQNDARQQIELEDMSGQDAHLRLLRRKDLQMVKLQVEQQQDQQAVKTS